MNREEKRVIEIFLGIILIVILVALIFLFTSQSNNTIPQPNTIISNSYNINTFTTYNFYKPLEKQKHYPKKIYYSSDDIDYNSNYKSSSKKETTKGMFGNNIDKYTVSIKNKGKTSEYFKVIFYFKDYSGKTSTASITKYIKFGEEEKFIYKDIHQKHNDWKYKIIP